MIIAVTMKIIPRVISEIAMPGDRWRSFQAHVDVLSNFIQEITFKIARDR